MPETLAVHLGREDPRSLEAPDAFEATGSFEVELRNHGEATHVHLRLEGDLAQAGRIEGDNPFVDGGSAERVHVVVDSSDETVRGALVAATGYGAEEERVAVELPGPVDDTVEVDESLATPQPREEPGLLARTSGPVLTSGVVVAVALAAGAFLLADSALAAVGVAVVVAVVFFVVAALVG